MTPDPDAVITSLRDDIRKARAELVDKIGPAQVEAFDKLLLGEKLPAIVAQPAPVVRTEGPVSFARKPKSQLDDAPVRPAVAAPVPGVPITATGTPIASLLDTRPLEGATRAVRNGIEIIQRVHGDGDLPQIEVIESGLGLPNAAYRGQQTDRATGQRVFNGRIDMNRIFTGNSATESFVHEFGHYLDDYLDMGFGKEATAAGLGKAFISSPTYQKLKQNKIDANDPNGNDAYLADPSEIWARAYAQWIGKRSQAPEMLDSIDRSRASGSLWYWQDDEFEPIATAIDKIFSILGYMRPGGG